MSPTAAARVFSGLTRAALSRGTFIHHATSSASRWSSVRSLSLSSQSSAKSTDEEVVNNVPIKFSTSKASHKTWKVDRSLGSQYKRPWWKVLPISLLSCAFILWCAFRSETDIDVKLEKQLHEHLPNIHSGDEEEAPNQQS